MVKFSVVVPIYKVEKYLRRCVDSLINQTLKDIEIILVDDGSPDGSPAICDEYAAKDSRIKVIHKKNGGVSAARNDGLKVATGEWVICMDSDDWAETDALESMYTAGQNSEADVVIADIYRVERGKKIHCQLFKNEFELSNPKDVRDLVVSVFYPSACPLSPTSKSGYGGPWNKAVRRQVVTNYCLEYNPNLMGVYDDRMFALNAYARAQKIKYIHKVVYNYVSVENSITKTYKPHILKINENIFNVFFDYIKQFYEGDEKINNAYNSLVVNRLCDAFSEYFFSVKNEEDWKIKKQKIKETIVSEPYASALKETQFATLSKFHSYISRVARLGNPGMIRMLFFARRILKNFGSITNRVGN